MKKCKPTAPRLIITVAETKIVHLVLMSLFCLNLVIGGILVVVCGIYLTAPARRLSSHTSQVLKNAIYLSRIFETSTLKHTSTSIRLKCTQSAEEIIMVFVIL
jgi:hypothetical protein